uniref:Uncharacterized protein n=1 Tax=Brassica oleracea TaxID=3712 RepID=A0A3P6EZF3_BRAOL|nr:unnamed protein product [Brassica oleracea]
MKVISLVTPFSFTYYFFWRLIESIFSTGNGGYGILGS